MSCAMAYWGLYYERFESVFLRFGAVVDVRHLRDKDIGVGEHPSLIEKEEIRTSAVGASQN